jgi:prepilin-type N-terminal cleavage/methylation domain-containing protein
MIQYFRRRSPDSNGGFTLIEVLVIVIIIAVLSAIAAPGWLAFMNNRRISTVRSQAADAIRKAQTEAKTKQTLRAVVFDTKSNPPRLAVTRCEGSGSASATTYDSSKCVLPAQLDWQTLGGGDIKSGSVQYTTVTKSHTGTYTPKVTDQVRLVFDGNGVIKKTLSDAPTAASVGATTSDGTALFIIGFQLTQSPDAKPRCLIVQTLLGGLREGNDNTKTECGV